MLGNILKYPFLDTDDLIESMAKMPIKDIFVEDGEASFRELETQVLQVGWLHTSGRDILVTLQTSEG